MEVKIITIQAKELSQKSKTSKYIKEIEETARVCMVHSTMFSGQATRKTRLCFHTAIQMLDVLGIRQTSFIDNSRKTNFPHCVKREALKSLSVIRSTANMQGPGGTQ
jgi:hypothetical protein